MPCSIVETGPDRDSLDPLSAPLSALGRAVAWPLQLLQQIASRHQSVIVSHAMTGLLAICNGCRVVTPIHGSVDDIPWIASSSIHFLYLLQFFSHILLVQLGHRLPDMVAGCLNLPAVNDTECSPWACLEALLPEQHCRRYTLVGWVCLKLEPARLALEGTLPKEIQLYYISFRPIMLRWAELLFTMCLFDYVYVVCCSLFIVVLLFCNMCKPFHIMEVIYIYIYRYSNVPSFTAVVQLHGTDWTVEITTRIKNPILEGFTACLAVYEVYDHKPCD